MRRLLIANPGTKRCETWLTELHAFSAERGETVDVEVIPWAEVITRDGIDNLSAFDQPAFVRLESPGKDTHVARLLLEAGARDDANEPSRDWLELELPKGMLLRPGLLDRGFRRILRGLRSSFGARPHLRPAACPLAVARMFDKTDTCRILIDAGIPTPEMLEVVPRSLAELVDLVKHWETTYVKLNAGSSASGILVLSNAGTERMSGITSLFETNGDFYNSRMLQRVNGSKLEHAMRFILDEGAIVQRGIPHAQIEELNFDVRVVCIGGKPSATIFRLSSNPMTNVLGVFGFGGPTRSRAAIPKRIWLDALDACSAAAGCFDSMIAGVDLIFERAYKDFYILEVNAFGDFFPGWTDERGRSIHRMELEWETKSSN